MTIMRSPRAGLPGLLAPALAGLLALALAGCVVSPYPTATAVASDQPTDQTEEQASEPPPPLPVYEQPPAPEEGYIWVPGVWRWGAEGYFWVPGTWVAPPSVGLLWTPGYWALAGPVYVFHAGYWGPHVGYYGGINYGHGYFGNGYDGGRWVNNRFQYNTAVTNVNVTNIHNTYNERVVNNVTNVTNVSRVSYAGAPGAPARPPAGAAPPVARELRVPPTAPQQQHHDMARTMPYQNAAHNVGRPPVAATPRPTAYTAHGVTSAKIEGPAYHPQHAPAPHEGPH